MEQKIRLPASCIQLDEMEQSALEGGGFIRLSQGCYALAQMFSPPCNYYGYEATARSLQQEHGDIVRLQKGTYTYADGYVYETAPQRTIFRTLYEFFYDVGDFFDAIGL